MESYPVLLNTPWVNHSLKGLAGWSITVSASTGVIIIAALALLVQMAGEATWGIVAFSLHQLRATDKPETGLFRQTQVLLRNPGTSLGTGIAMVQVGWKWHGVVNKALPRSIGLALIPLCLFGGFVAAGILVSRVTALPNEFSQVLLWPSNCGLQNWDRVDNQSMWSEIGGKWASDIRRSRAYATDCYGETHKSLGCSTLPVQRIPFSVKMNVSCPVRGKRCFGGTIQFDTGLLDSHEYLGINSNHESRVQFQMVSTCSPIDISDTYSDTADEFIKDSYTNDLFVLQTYLGPYGVTNYTYSYATYQALQQLPYHIESFRKMAGPRNASGDYWQPNEEFRLSDQDLTVALIAFNSVVYSQESYDPVFSADGTYQQKVDDLEYNLPDRWFSAIACTDQLRICNPNPQGTCTPLTGAYLVRPMGLKLNERQEATAERIIDARLHSTIFDVIFQQGGNALMASDLLTYYGAGVLPRDQWLLQSPPLPSNQWILETTKWFQTAMANVQYRIVEFPNNEWDTDPSSGLNVVRPEDWFEFSSDAMRDLCNQQLVRSTDEYQTFSLEGIVIVIVVSFILIIFSCTLEWCVFQPRRRRHPEGFRRYKRLAYAADGKLQLLRVVLEKAGYAGWHDKLEDIPFRIPKDDLDQKDIKPTFEEPESFQMRNMHGSVDAGVAPGSNMPKYAPLGAQLNYSQYGWIDPMVRPSSAPGHRERFGYMDDSAPLLRGR